MNAATSTCTLHVIRIPFETVSRDGVQLRGDWAPLSSGSWSFTRITTERYSNRGNFQGADTIWGLSWTRVIPTTVFSAQLRLKMEGEPTFSQTHDLLFGATKFPKTGQQTFSLSTANRSASCTAELHVVVADEGRRVSDSAISSFTRSLQSPFSNVRLFFPRANREIWTSAELLKISPYFKELLSSDFSEGRLKNRRTTVDEAMARLEPKAFDDSDEEDEDDDVAAQELLGKEGTLKELEPFYEVIIYQAAYSTYASLVVWLQTGHLRQAPLSSSFLLPEDSTESARDARKKHLASIISSDVHQRPCPCSPKSLCRLSHFLSLPTLSALALASYRSQLTTSNIADELFTDLAVTYEHVADIALTFAASNWNEIKKGAAMKGVQDRLEKGEVELPSTLMMRLMMKLGEV